MKLEVNKMAELSKNRNIDPAKYLTLIFKRQLHYTITYYTVCNYLVKDSAFKKGPARMETFHIILFRESTQI